MCRDLSTGIALTCCFMEPPVIAFLRKGRENILLYSKCMVLKGLQLVNQLKTSLNKCVVR